MLGRPLGLLMLEIRETKDFLKSWTRISSGQRAFFLGWRYNDRQTNPPGQFQLKKSREVKVDNLDHVSNIDVEVSKTLEVSNDCIAGRLKHCSSQLLNITSDYSILDSVTQDKIEFAAVMGSGNKSLYQGKSVIPFQNNILFKMNLTNCRRKE